MFPALYAILDPSLVAAPLLPLAENLAHAGVGLIQLRDKTGSPREVFIQARELSQALPPRGVRFIVNDRPDIAAIAGACGVHVGQEDLSVEDARHVVGPSHWVGVSTHNLEQFREALATSADYIAVGPIFPTTSKANPDPVVGVEFVRQARRLTQKPLVAIGGITLENAGEVYAAGADSVAVIRDLIGADDPAGRARQFLAVAKAARTTK